jgi:hydrogenase maturation factor HypE
VEKIHAMLDVTNGGLRGDARGVLLEEAVEERLDRHRYSP